MKCPRCSSTHITCHDEAVDKAYCLDCGCLWTKWQQSIISEQREEIERLTDLVRYQRGPLLETGLITQEEYLVLLQTHGSVERLHGYDLMRNDRNRYSAALDEIEKLQEVHVADEYEQGSFTHGFVIALNEAAAIARKAKDQA